MTHPSFTTPDIYDEHLDDCQILEIPLQHFGGHKQFQGKIETVKCHEDNSLIKQYFNENGEGKVLVVDGGGSLRYALLGDQVAAKAVENQWQGIIIFGCVRDVTELRHMPLGIMALASTPRKTQKYDFGHRSIILNFGQVKFTPGDQVYADENGVILI